MDLTNRVLTLLSSSDLIRAHFLSMKTDSQKETEQESQAEKLHNFFTHFYRI